MLIKERLYEGEYIKIGKNHPLNASETGKELDLRCIGSYPHHHLFLDEETGIRYSYTNVDLWFLGYVQPLDHYLESFHMEMEKERLLEENKNK